MESSKEDKEETKEEVKQESTNADGTEAVDVVATNFNPNIRSKRISVFISQDKSWDD